MRPCRRGAGPLAYVRVLCVCVYEFCSSDLLNASMSERRRSFSLRMCMYVCMYGSGFRVSGFGFRVSGFGFRI